MLKSYPVRNGGVKTWKFYMKLSKERDYYNGIPFLIMVILSLLLEAAILCAILRSL
jgi:hypothetical protein